MVLGRVILYLEITLLLRVDTMCRGRCGQSEYERESEGKNSVSVFALALTLTLYLTPAGGVHDLQEIFFVNGFYEVMRDAEVTGTFYVLFIA